MQELFMKLTKTKTCMRLFYALACLLLMGICPGGALCSGPASHVNFNHAIHDECCKLTHVWSESHFCIAGTATGHLNHECCQHGSNSPFHFSCGGGFVLPNHTTSSGFAVFARTGTLTCTAALAQNGLPSPSSGTAHAALPLLRTVILLT